MVTRSSGKVHSPLPPSPTESGRAALILGREAASHGGSRRSHLPEDEARDPKATPQPRFGVLKGGKTYDSKRRKSGE
jgi:hypothetical protein